MDYIIFLPYKKVSTGYEGKVINKTNKEINKIVINRNLKLNTLYYIKGNINDFGDYIVSDSFEYIVFIGDIVERKENKINRNNLLKILTEDNCLYKVNINSIDIELNKKHIVKGYINSKGIIEGLFIKPLINLKLEIKNDVNIYSYGKNLDKLSLKTKCNILNLKDSKFNAEKKETIFIKGKMSNMCQLFKGDEITAYGYYENKYFNVLSCEKNISDSIKMMDTYLKNILGKLITKQQRKNIFDLYGLNTINILSDIKNDKIIINDYFNKYKKDFPKDKDTKEYKLDKIRSCITTSKYLQEFFFFCEKEYIPSKFAEKIFNEFKDRAIIELQKNPYQIIINDFNYFKEADIIAKKFCFSADNEFRIKASILAFLNKENESGHVFTFYDDLLNGISVFLNNIGVFDEICLDKKNIDKLLDELELEDLIKIDKNMIYLSYIYFYERSSFNLLKNLIEDFKTPFCNRTQIESAINDFEKKCKLDGLQKDSIFNALLNNVSILTGGPGTGKTLTVSAIIESIKKIKPTAKIKLSAPTGRASKRMNEVSGYPATTIHKLLHIGIYSKLDDVKSEELENVDYLIIDEFSMVDIKLFYQILSNLDDNTRLIIVGDYHQLPSVGAGQVMKDLILSNKIPTIELTKIFRQKGNSDIVELAHDIVNNKIININKFKIKKEKFKELLDKDKSLYFIDNSNETEIMNSLYEILDIFINNGKSFNDIQILNATNVYSIGSNNLNNNIQKIYNKSKNKDDLFYVGNNKYFCNKDKIIQTVNDYESNVMNGSIGFIKNIFYDSFIVDYMDENDNIEYTLENVSNIQLAYSISIHKSQGSEYPIVIIPFSSTQKMMLNMNLFYTAITRAKVKLIILGDSRTFIDSLKILGDDRNSYLLNLLNTL